jgi:FtsP/CotA-like multicopper oxidase with cupredoxin domain
MLMRPDLFDPHSIHWHGFPNAASVFDGEPMASATINMGSSFTYYYEPQDPGTYMYHCHVEATEHMQMGMLGNLYVTPAQDGSTINGCTSAKYAYNDGDGSTCYDVDYPLQIQAFDSNFHEKHINIQPLPFAMMKDDYPMLNGRGYPDTINPNPLPPLQENGGKVSQPVSSLITATQGQKILLRISSLSTVEYYTLSVAGIPMKVIGKDAKLLRSTTGQNLYYYTNSITLGGGESYDVILDTSGVAPGTYVLYTTNLHNLSNGAEDFGGMMTEIVIQ